jgi:hypothetical protein
MSLIWMDGFDSYTSAGDPSFPYVGNLGFSTSSGRFGGGCCQLAGYYSHGTLTFPSSETEVWLGFAFNVQETITSGDYVIGQFNSGSGIESTLTLGPSGAWKTWRGAQNTQIGATGTEVVITNQWHWVEVHMVLSATVGVFELWIDDIQVVNATGANTAGAGGSSLIGWEFGGQNNACEYNFDDLYVLNTSGSVNNSRLRDSKIVTLVPASDAGPNDGALTSGSSHFAMVDEAQNDGLTTTTTLTNTSGQEELFGMGSLAGSPSAIHAVKVGVIAEKSDAGACSLETVMNSGGTVSTGASTPLTTDFATVGTILEEDPNTSSPWTLTAINAMKCGVKIP